MKSGIEGLVCRLGHDARPFHDSPSHSQGAAKEHRPSKDSLFEPVHKLKKGEIIVAGRNFGCGLQDSGVIGALKGLEIPCIVAASFARRFYRNAINGGLPVIESAETFEAVSTGEHIAIDFDRCEINYKRGIIRFRAYPDIVAKILASGGLIQHTRRITGK
jgi:3-isopropylmalate/(R)-2-methylmalate dehydratase small subunit